MSKSHGAFTRFLRSLFRIGGGAAVEADLYRSKQTSKSVLIRYRNNRGQVTKRVINVIGIGNGYIDAFDSRRSEIRTFRVSRIQWTELTESTFTLPDSYSQSGWVSTGRGELR